MMEFLELIKVYEFISYIETYIKTFNKMVSFIEFLLCQILL